MNAEKSIATLRYLLQEDIYLLGADKEAYRNPPPVAPSIPEIPAIETPAIDFQYFGGNKKHFLVLCHYAQEQFMPEAHLKALESTLGRISYSQDDIALLNLANHPETTFNQLADYFEPQKLLILGSRSVPKGMAAISMNEVQPLDELLTLYTFGFDEMMGHKENTKAFWNQIKTF